MQCQNLGTGEMPQAFLIITKSSPNSPRIVIFLSPESTFMRLRSKLLRKSSKSQSIPVNIYYSVLHWKANSFASLISKELKGSLHDHSQLIASCSNMQNIYSPLSTRIFGRLYLGL